MSTGQNVLGRGDVAMGMASFGKALSAKTPPGVIDIEEVSSLTNAVLAMWIGTSTRAQMDAWMPKIAEQLNALVGQELGQQEDEHVRWLVDKGRSLIESQPTAQTAAFGVFTYLRDAALLMRRLLWVYAEQNGVRTP
ncbi:hypothetical protein ABZ832_10690 [Streptantibioticus parmotrematis]|uniref:hypothetical protein n=1 Tax=Streptantibioticus parmotrematis TaxID=2873249 RepID=UPI0033FA8327